MTASSPMVGADADALMAAAAELRSAADRIDADATALDGALKAVTWMGNVALRFIGVFDGTHRPAMRTTAEFIRDGARMLQENAEAQIHASRAAPMLACTPQERLLLAPWQRNRTSSFGRFTDGRSAVIEAFYGTTDRRRTEEDEIEIRALANGSYIVVLPGVVDLSSGLSEFAPGGSTTEDRWFDRNEYNSVRDMRYATVLAQQGSSFENPYSSVVIEQMKAAGVPAGANVMIVGHSYGAYTAIDLAADARFNTADASADGYHVNVTHVVAAGAETDWRLRELPASTKALVLNNRYDAAFQAEDRLHANAGPSNGGQLEVVFSGGVKGAGHHPDLYANFLTEAHDRPDLNAWLEDAGHLYADGGVAAPVKVWDPI